jgi:hypothetical protein
MIALVNEYFETIEEIEEKPVQRCCVLENMTEEIKNLTDYHWLTYS